MNEEKTVYIGDREIDVKCANYANINSCFYDKEIVCDFANYNIKSFKEFLDNYCN